jgi:hypothetical protein
MLGLIESRDKTEVSSRLLREDHEVDGVILMEIRLSE